tara:strand:- start:32957 stop:33490 length:534 start_codon:yes stop_codon:yes gene_type:complete
MQNIEIKAKYEDHTKLKLLTNNLGCEYVGLLHQVDTYYATKSGRLKLREFINEKDRAAELIPYAKDYSTGPMKSMYSVLKSTEPENLKTILDNILGVIAIVDKKREVYLYENIRIHIDLVKDLGAFMELEAVYEENGPNAREKEVQKVNKLMNLLQVPKENLLDKSYVDYLLSNENT